MSSKGGVIVVVSGEDKTGEVFNAIKKHLDETEAKAKEASSSLAGIGQSLMQGLQYAGITVGIGEVVNGLREMVTSTMEAGVQIGKLHQQTGISTDSLSVLKYAAAASGVEFETVAKSGKKLAEAIHETDAGKLSEGFKILGISAEEVKTKGNDMYGVMELVADKFQQMPDGIEKNVAAVKLFGKAGQDMIPILNQGSEALEKMKSEAPIFSEEDLKKMEDMHHALNDLDAAWKRLSLTITGTAAPFITAYVNDFAEGMDTIIASAKDMWHWLSDDGKHPLDEYLAQLHAAQNLAASTAHPTGPAKLPPTDPEVLEKQSRARMQADRTSLAEQQRQHAMSIEDEIAFWQKRIGAFQRGSSQYLEALNEINRLTKEVATKNAQEQKKITSEFVSESIADAKNAQSENDHITEAITKTWEDTLKAQEESAQAEATAAEVRSAATAKVAEAAVEHDKAAKSISDEAAAQAVASIRAKQYAADIVVLNALLNELEQIQSRGGDTSKERNEVQNQITSLGGEAAANSLIAAPISKNNAQSIDNEAEKFAHGLFDPLFDLGEKWDKQWKQIRANMLKDIGQTAESQLFGELFGDPSGRGGKGWDGSGAHGAGTGGHNGLVGQGIGGAESLLKGLFGKKSGPTSNGTGNAGAGTVLSSVAGALQVGKGSGSGAGGVQVILNNMGTPQQVDSTQQSSGQAEAMILQIVLKDQETNGAITQGFAGMFGH